MSEPRLGRLDPTNTEQLRQFIDVIGAPPWAGTGYEILRFEADRVVRLAQIGEQLHDTEHAKKRYAVTVLLAAVPALVAQIEALRAASSVESTP